MPMISEEFTKNLIKANTEFARTAIAKVVFQDFSEGQAPTHKQARPLKADSQCHKLAVALLHGSLTSMKAISITGGSEAPRRLRELRTMLKAHGIELIEEWVENWDSEKKHTRFKRYTIAFADLEKFKELIGI